MIKHIVVCGDGRYFFRTGEVSVYEGEEEDIREYVNSIGQENFKVENTEKTLTLSVIKITRKTN